MLDAGEQPPADYFPRAESPGPDPVFPLQMWLCASCGLAQLVSDPTLPEEVRSLEPAAVAAQAADAVERLAAAGLLRQGNTVAEYDSPHGGSWTELFLQRGLVPAKPGEPANLVIDSFGLMHAADQSGALARRAARVAPGGVLLLQYHSLDTIVRRGQWNALRHGHYAYYSTTALATMLGVEGFSPRRAWHFELYGGTILLAAGRDADSARDVNDTTVPALLAQEARTGIRDPEVLGGLQRQMQTHTRELHDWLVAARESGVTALGYGAASRAVALLVRAGADTNLLPAMVDAAPAKAGRRMPGTDIPVVAPSQLAARQPTMVLLFVPDLLDEVRAAFPEVEASGGRWVDIETLDSSRPGAQTG